MRLHAVPAFFVCLAFALSARSQPLPPTITLTSPPAELLTSNTTLLVSGQISVDPTALPATLTVNNIPVSFAEDGTFTYTMTLVEGWNRANAVVIDAYQRMAYVNADITLDTESPGIWFNEVSDGMVTSDPITPGCWAGDDNLLSFTVTLDGAPYTCDTTIPVVEGTHQLYFRADDEVGHVTGILVRFAFDLTPPVITVSGVQDGSTVSGPVTATISINDLHLAGYAVWYDDNWHEEFQNGDSIVFNTVGGHSIFVTTHDAANNESGLWVDFTISDVQSSTPTWPTGSILSASATSNTSVALTWTPAMDTTGVTGYRLYQNGALVQTLSGTTLSTTITGLTTGVSSTFQVQAGNAAGNWSTDGPIRSYMAAPPDPQLIAPALDTTIATRIAAATAFLYTGANAVQVGVPAGTIKETQAAVLRGRVRDRASQPIAGVKISVLNHSEYGNTWSRADGTYDLAVNGGGSLVLKYERTDLLPVQRRVTPVWQDYTPMPDVVMVPYDGLSSLLTSGSSNTQVARGSVSIDEIGSRQAAVIIPPGTSATLVMPDGSTQSLSSFHVRATELTVGADGPRAMPGPLPSTSAYTYAVAFTSDEAVQAGASHVQFSQPVFGYVENFLALPVGTVIPSGSYDSTGGRWLPEGNGKIVQILSTANGVAILDSNGDGQADDANTLAALGVSNAELASLAAMYQPGQSLWRVPMVHFSWFDFNFSWAKPPGAISPLIFADTAPSVPQACSLAGCIIEAQNQVLKETIPIVGTPYQLGYTSMSVPGRRANYRANITVPAPFNLAIPASVSVCLPNRTPQCQTSSSTTQVRVESAVSVSVAGQGFSRSSTSTPIGGTSTWSFEWDGKDVYGRDLQGEQPVTIRSCYTYPGVGYSGMVGGDFLQAWAQPTPTGTMVAFRWVGTASAVYDLCTEKTTTIGAWNAKRASLGGWSFSNNHVLDPRNKTVYRGDGGIQRVDDLNRFVINRYAGTGQFPSGTNTAFPDGSVAKSVIMGSTTGLVVGDDGSVYFSEPTHNMIGRVTPDGIFHYFAGTLNSSGGSDADGVLALQANLRNPGALAFGPDGSLYFVDRGLSPGARIRRVTPDGHVYTVAGNGTSGFAADGAVATSSPVGISYNDTGGSIAVGPDGTLYFGEALANRVRKVGPDGILRTVAGSGTAGFGGDHGPALQAALNTPRGVALGLDGTVYIADSCNNRIRRVTTDGIIDTIAGSGPNTCSINFNNNFFGDGGLATSAGLFVPKSLVVSEGAVIVGDFLNLHVRRFSVGGTIESIAGNFDTTIRGEPDWPATQYFLGRPEVLALGVRGDVYVGDNATIGRISSALARELIGVSNIPVPSPDAGEVYVFDFNGRHLKTLDSLTNAQLELFGYDTGGRLVSITDRAANVTTIQRDAQGNPTAIVGPYSQQTTLGLDSDGYLHTVTNPNAEMVQLFYKPVVAGDPHTGGLLSQYTDARNGSSLYEYDGDGFLTKDTRPDGSWQTFSRNGTLAPKTVTRTTTLGRTETFKVSTSDSGEAEARDDIDAAGLHTRRTRNPDHTGSITSPDGTSIMTAELADPRFGIQSAYTATTSTRMPSGLTRTESRSRSITLSDPQDPLSLSALIESVTVAGRTSQSSYSAASRRMTVTSAAGRVTTIDYDALGRVTQVAPPGVYPAQLHYDARGRNDTITQGTRVTTLAYRTDGFLDNILDPLSHRTSFGYDLAGRPTSETQPDSTVVGMGYDPNGNVTSVTPPGRPAHIFAFTAGDQEKDYTPPDVGQPRTTHTDYNLDQQVSNVSRPDGDYITPTYDPTSGRLTALTTSRGTNTYGYDSTTGQLASISTFDGVGLTYGYDGSLLKDITWSGPVSGNVHKTYDSSFRLASESVTGGQTINFGYDNDDLLTSAGAMTIARDPTTGFVTGSTLGAINESRTYDAFGAEKTYTVTANGTTLYAVDYGTRDGLGRIVNKTETIQGTTHVYGYTYYPNGALKDVTKDGNLTSHYDYDANGNRLVGPGLTASPVYDNQDRLLSYGSCTYTYKNDGSLQTKTCPDGTTTYDYDSFGNLRGVTLSNGTAITYVIDGQNRRVGKKVNGTLVEGFLYRSQLQPTAWLNADGSVRASFIYFSRPNVPEYMQSGGATYRLIADQIGSVRLVVDSATGAVSEKIDYDEFGQLLGDSNPRFQPFNFAGGLSDAALSVIRFGSRDYDSRIGRWYAKDPLAFDGGLWNLYSFVGGDPNNRIDPDGLTTWVCEKPLDFLGGKGAPSTQRKSLPWPPSIFNDLFHQYLCTDVGGVMTCGGLGQKDNRPFGPGKRLFDGFNPNRCDPISRKDCIDKCVKRGIVELDKNPPYYALIGNNCQDWSNALFSSCQRQCAPADGIWSGP